MSTRLRLPDALYLLTWTDPFGRIQFQPCTDMDDVKRCFDIVTNAEKAGDYYIPPDRVFLFSALGNAETAINEKLPQA